MGPCLGPDARKRTRGCRLQGCLCDDFIVHYFFGGRPTDKRTTTATIEQPA